MTEQNLRHSWFKKKAVKRFWFTFVLVNLTAWMMEITSYNDIAQPAKHYYLGILCMVATMLFLAVISVHRESFSENWDVTLRRLPNYRAKYMATKLGTVLFPVVIYVGYWGSMWLVRCIGYYAELSEDIHAEEKKDVFDVIPFRALGELCLYGVLFAISVLLLSFTLRKLRKDLPGFFAAIAGVAMSVLLFTEVIRFSELWMILCVSAGLIAVMLVFLLRHVYRKL
ncbi:MAG: hypothetical protein IKT67_05120 [Lachnospiraceae bacterium]|nr:hypothetical protein [Lachnospiraceae bacterium]